MSLLIAIPVAVGGSLTTQAADSARCRTIHSDHGILEILHHLSAGIIDETIRGTLPKELPIDEIKQKVDKKTDEILNRAGPIDPERLGKFLTGLQQRVFAVDEVRVDQIELRVDDERVFAAQGGLRRTIRKLVEFVLTEGHVEGSVRLNYRVCLGKYVIYRETLVRDEHVVLTTRIAGGIPRLTSATLVNDAHQSGPPGAGPIFGKETNITNTIYARAPYGHCPIGPVTLIVERVMDRKIDEILCKIEREGRRAFAAGEQYSLMTMSNRFLQEITGGRLQVADPNPLFDNTP